MTEHTPEAEHTPEQVDVSHTPIVEHNADLDKPEQEHVKDEKVGPYFKEDDSYDQRFYSNKCGNYFLIYGAILSVWITVALIWWGIFSFGIYSSKWMDIFSLIMWGCTVLFIIFLLIVGKQANTIKKEHLFW